MGAKASKVSKSLMSFGSLKSLKVPPSLMMTPRGYIPVAVGLNDEKTRRFVVHTSALCDAEFVMEFLRRSAEEYEFCMDGILKIPYDAVAFEEWMMTRRDQYKHNIIRVEPT